jgi:hypothetical protein
MKPEISYDELVARLAAAPDETTRRLFFAATLASAAGMRGEQFIVVGGSAIELYTSGEYTSADIDIVAVDSKLVRSILESWGFSRAGRGLESKALRLFVDLVKYPYTGSVARLRPMGTPYGAVQVAAVEDLIVKRLLSTRFWKVAGDLEHAKMLAYQYYQSIDWVYLEEYARREEVLDIAQDLRAAARKAREPHETPQK